MDETGWQRVLPAGLAQVASAFSKNLCEVRLRLGRPPELRLTDGSQWVRLPPSAREDLAQVVEIASHHSLYAVADQVRQGYLTIEGGHRLGLCGHAVIKDGMITALRNISSLNLRIARQVTGISEPVLNRLRTLPDFPQSTLLLSPPGYGKTTLLRDLARLLSSNEPVSIVDERGELAACTEGVPAFDLGPRCDVLDGYPKPEGITLAVRSMAPRFLITDELGTAADCEAVLRGSLCGVCFFASAHAASLTQARQNPQLRRLFDSGAIHQAVTLLPDFITSGHFICEVLP